MNLCGGSACDLCTALCAAREFVAFLTTSSEQGAVLLFLPHDVFDIFNLQSSKSSTSVSGCAIFICDRASVRSDMSFTDKAKSVTRFADSELNLEHEVASRQVRAPVRSN